MVQADMTDLSTERTWRALQLATLAYEDRETIEKWVDGGVGDIVGGKVWFESQVRQEDVKGVRAVYFGEDPVGNFHKAQWLAGEVGSTLYIAFKGTDTVTDLFLDTSLSDVLTPNGTRLHSGFYSGIQQELPTLIDLCNQHPCTDIVFCGHSLGGAYATVACLELQSSILWDRGVIGEAITFGSPLTVCASSEKGPPVLPSRLAATPPKMTHFIANYDAVPRLLALRRETAVGYLEEIPMLLAAGPLSAVVSLAKRAGYAKADAIVDNTQHLRSCFRCVGTYVLCTSATLGGVRSASFSVVPPEDAEHGGVWNRAALEHLRFFPPFDAAANEESYTDGAQSAARQEFVRQSVSDHYLAPSYWAILDQMRHMKRNANSGLVRRAVDPVRPLQDALVTYDPFSALGVVVPNDAILKEMSEEDRRGWDGLLGDLKRLSHAATHARDAALAKHSSPTPPESPRAQRGPDAVVAAVLNCSAATGGGGTSLTTTSRKKAACKVYVVNMVPNDGVVVESADISFEEKVMYKTACFVDGFAGDTLKLKLLPDERVVEVKLPITARGEKRVLVVEASGAGVVVWDSRVREVSKGSWMSSMLWEKKKKPEEKTQDDFESEKVTAFHPTPASNSRVLHLQILSKYLEHQEVTYNALDKAPRGLGAAEGVWEKKECCHLCTAKFANVGKPSRHHCRECGRSVCSKCSPMTYYNSLSPQEPVRICDKCHIQLFPFSEKAQTPEPSPVLAEKDEIDHQVITAPPLPTANVQPQW